VWGFNLVFIVLMRGIRQINASYVLWHGLLRRTVDNVVMIWFRLLSISDGRFREMSISSYKHVLELRWTLVMLLFIQLQIRFRNESKKWLSTVFGKESIIDWTNSMR